MVEYVVVGNIIIDDIVLPDGTVQMNTLGGGGTHALMGTRAWGTTVAFVSAIGHDFPTEHWERLSASGVDLSGVQRRQLPTPRAWQLFETDGQRTEVFRTPFEDLQRLEARPADFPQAYAGARGAYIMCDRPGSLHSWVAHLRHMGVSLILWEPSAYLMSPQQRTDFASALPKVDIISPDLESAARLYENTNPQELALTMHQDGAQVVALRMGKRGSLVSERGGPAYVVPIWPAQVVDVTGAGNAYCGGLLVGYAESNDAYTAGLYGAVSASFAVEQFGPIVWRPNLPQEAARCLDMLKRSSGTGGGIESDE